MFRLFEPILVALLWVLLFASPIILDDSDYSLDWSHIFTAWLTFIPFFILFLINRFILLPHLFFKDRRPLFVVMVMVLIAVMSVVDYSFQSANNHQIIKPGIQGPVHRRPNPNEMPPPPTGDRGPDSKTGRPNPPRQLPPYLSFMIVSILIIGFDTSLKLSVKWVQSEQKRMTAEKDNVNSQLAFLRNQVSPHFFMNTLNNIHALIDVDTNEARESIIRLSKLMRHLLYNTDVELISIKEEIDFIETYMDLMKMRYSENVRIELRLLKEIPNKRIPPLLFTSYVENAFKHGISYQQASFVEVTFSFTEGNLIFEVRNSKPETKRDSSPVGIGIENSRKRLDLIYGDNYSLEVMDRKDEFCINLNIPL